MSLRKVISPNSSKNLSAIFLCQKRCESTTRSNYDILGIPSQVSSNDVETAYLHHLKQNHYSRGNRMTLGTIAEHREKRKAYYVLRHKETRETYDYSSRLPVGTFDHDCLAVPLDVLIAEDQAIHDDEMNLNKIEKEIRTQLALQSAAARNQNFKYAFCVVALLATGFATQQAVERKE